MISGKSSGAAAIAMVQQEGGQNQRIADQFKYAQTFAGDSDAQDAGRKRIGHRQDGGLLSRKVFLPERLKRIAEAAAKTDQQEHGYPFGDALGKGKTAEGQRGGEAGDPHDAELDHADR